MARADAVDETARFVQLLEEAASHVARMPASPGSRELKGRLDQYHRAIHGWTVSVPTASQRDAMHEQIVAVLDIAKQKSPTVKTRRPPVDVMGLEDGQWQVTCGSCDTLSARVTASSGVDAWYAFEEAGWTVLSESFVPIARCPTCSTEPPWKKTTRKLRRA
jgi:hypothetical protein